MIEYSASYEDESVVSEDATVQSVNAEETVNDGMAVAELEQAEESPLLEMEEMPLKEVVLEVPAEELVVTDDKFIIKIGDDRWLKSWFSMCDNVEDALVMNSDWARGNYKRVTKIMRLKAEVIKL